MATNTTPLPIPQDAQDRVVNYLSAAFNLYGGSFNIRSQLLERDRAYYREQDQSGEHRRAQEANRAGDPTKIQSITVPVVMPQVESALAYLSETFLTGYPIFGVVAPPKFADALASMEAVIGENSVRGAWPLELMKTLRNGLKYDLGAVEVVWEKKKTFSIETPDIANLNRGKTKETQYEGNFMYDRSPYNLILDTRVSPERNHIEGEYAGYTEMLSRIETKKRMGDLDILGTMNFRKGYESGVPGAGGSGDTGFYMPEINPSALLPADSRTGFDWMVWSGQAADSSKQPIAYKNSYEWTVLYARIVPKEFGINVKGAGEIQIWKFIVLNRSVVIYAERQTNAHSYLPIIVCKPSNDGMAWQSKSFAQNAEPIQQLSSALVNSGLASQRRKVYDRMLYDPTKVRKQDIDNVSPVARIPVRNAQMGKGLQDAVYQMPYRDDGVAEIMQLGQQVVGFGDILNGQNRVQQGQFQKGNKTRSEFETVMSNSNSRQKMVAIGLEFSFFSPIKEIIKANILQYQPPVSIVNSNNGETVEVDPAVLREALISFKLSDGLLPSDKIIDPSMFQALLQAAPAMPQIQAEYDLMGMFAYVMKLKGAHWVSDFKRSPEEMQAQMQQMAQAAQATGNAQPPQQPPQQGVPQ